VKIPYNDLEEKLFEIDNRRLELKSWLKNAGKPEFESQLQFSTDKRLDTLTGITEILEILTVTEHLIKLVLEDDQRRLALSDTLLKSEDLEALSATLEEVLFSKVIEIEIGNPQLPNMMDLAQQVLERANSIYDCALPIYYDGTETSYEFDHLKSLLTGTIQ